MLELVIGEDLRRRLRLRQMTIAELLEIYEPSLRLRRRSDRALEEALRVLGHFRNHFGHSPPSRELATEFLSKFAERAPTTLQHYHSIVCGFMKWVGIELDTKIRVPQRLPAYVEADAIEKLKEAVRVKKTHRGVIARNLLIIDLGCKAGLRRSVIAGLLVHDVDLARNCLVVRMGKGMMDRAVELAPSLRGALRDYLAEKEPDQPVIGVSPSTISDIVAWAARKAGVDVHTHSLRHFFGQSLVDTGTDVETVRRLMGHTDLKVTQQYLGRSDKHRREAIERLEAKSSSPTGAISAGEPAAAASGPSEDGALGKPGTEAALLQECRVTLGGKETDALALLCGLWRKLDAGLSRTDFAVVLQKLYPSEQMGMEYFDAADSIIGSLSLYDVVRPTQHRVASARTSWDETFWALTDIGRGMVRHLVQDPPA